ncbi:MAG: Asp-tRNA(Asn)/Glu-tRNA(Gln) amidotransferase subunit GatC [Cyclobacteriaceae bacterium]
MQIDKETLQKIAHLARLEIKAEDEPAMIEDLNNILTWVEQLNEVDTEKVEPLTVMSLEVNAFREDEVKDHIDREDALKNSPDSNEKYFKVPKFLGNS